jgi:predicted transcriptional regulator
MLMPKKAAAVMVGTRVAPDVKRLLERLAKKEKVTLSMHISDVLTAYVETRYRKA